MEKTVFTLPNGNTETMVKTADGKTAVVVRDKNGKVLSTTVKK